MLIKIKPAIWRQNMDHVDKIIENIIEYLLSLYYWNCRIGRISFLLSIFLVLPTISAFMARVFNMMGITNLDINSLPVILFFYGIIVAVINRFRDLNIAWYWVFLMLLPPVNIVLFIYACVFPGKKKQG
jgi:hypothetical protein